MLIQYGSAPLHGTISMPPSKSAAHRLILGAALAALSGHGRSTVHPVDLSNDIKATLHAVQQMGFSLSYEEATRTVTVEPGWQKPGSCTLDCGESGSTLRFLIPLAAALGITATFVGHGKLPQRPIGCFDDCLPQNGAQLVTEGGLPLTVSGQLKPGTYALPGHVSSQFITGLLYALPLLPGDSTIVLTTPLQSAGYVDMTRQALSYFGITVHPTKNGWQVPGHQAYTPGNVTVEGDWSQAAFFLMHGALAGGPLSLKGLRMDSTQGDRAITDLMLRFGADVEEENGVLTVQNPLAGEPFAGLCAMDIDAGEIPDLVPALAVVAALSEGVTQIYNAGRLRIKECDRLQAMADNLNRLGGQVETTQDSLLITGVPRLRGGKVPGYNDHRIVMAMSGAALRCDGPVTVTEAESIRKSYPGFFDDARALGGDLHVIHDR